MTVGGSLISTFLTSAASFFSHFSLFSFISIFSVFLSFSGKPHNTIHQNSATLFCHHQNYPKKELTFQSRRRPALNNPPQTHRKNNHIPTPAQLIQLHHRSPTQQPPNQPNAPNPKPMAKPTSQISDPHHHNHTHFSNLKPNTKPMEKKKNEGSLSRKIKENKFRIWRGDEILR